MSDDQIVRFGREILEQESRAISELSTSLDEGFKAAVELILNMAPDGRLVLVGMGKAGIIAQKISATFASTGVPSFFLHPAEAVHGDLGRFTDRDIAMILSNSGETEEILKVLPHIKRMGCPIVSITSNPQSALGEHSDTVLKLGRWEEAGPLGLAPTTSAIGMLALGDALAMTVLSQQNFTKEQFAFYHPGGSLGRSLMQVSEVMRTGEQVCLVNERMLNREVVHEISATPGRPGAALIVNEQGVLTGIFTDGDLRRCLETEKDFLDLPVAETMTKDPKNVRADHLAQEALGIMSSHKIDQLVVTDSENKPIGLIDIQDLVAVQAK